jgi:hypothetical protein
MKDTDIYLENGDLITDFVLDDAYEHITTAQFDSLCETQDNFEYLYP